MPQDEKILKSIEIQKIPNRYQDVNKNEVIVRGENSGKRGKPKQQAKIGSLF